MQYDGLKNFCSRAGQDLTVNTPVSISHAKSLGTHQGEVERYSGARGQHRKSSESTSPV
jgi:hypothetical protein